MELYVLTQHWESDLDFFRDELKFLSSLIGKYFIWMTREENISKVEKMVKNVSALEQTQIKLRKDIKKHLSNIAGLIENAFAHDESEFRTEHGKLEEEIALFTKIFRSTKKEIFTITEHVIETEKLKHLLAK